MRGDLRSLLKYWGKANARDSVAPDHPLLFHSMDVAACARIYLDHCPDLTDQLGRWLDLEAEGVRDVVTFLLAVHDVGKFAENFQNKAPEVVRARFGEELAPLNSTMYHDDVGALFLAWAFEDRPKPECMLGWDDDVWITLLTAVFGHHGTPPTPAPMGRHAAHARLRSAMSERSREDAWTFFDWCAHRFLPPELTSSKVEADLASWWIAGLAVLADWIGSNTVWFEYADESRREKSLDQYWEHWALPAARRAIVEAGVVAVRPRPYTQPDRLFPYLRGGELRPAQALAATLSIGDEPQIFFLEDATGAGKTEASLILAARLIDAGLADGMFFGLPTQATADQMFDRVAKNIPAWFEEPARATLVLAHGARDQVKAFQSLSAQSNDAIPGELDTASLRVTQWLAQSNKRALQAQIGVGTLDQALMASLRIKHQSLRILGLFRKVLLVDEVHSYDPYMRRVLSQTLRLHAAAGGCAILLSATMSRELRSSLLDAYAEGAALWRQRVLEGGRRKIGTPRVSAKSLEYPLLTRWGPWLGLQPEETTFPASAHSHRALDIEYLSDEKDVLARIDRWHEMGQAVVWVRNTVSDAITVWEKLSSRFGTGRCTLFHSRFAGVDRRRIQNDVLHALGKDSGAAARSGRIIVTTQVFQESLDADADQMICDLCPVDVLLQRLGRYRRHLRAANGNRLPSGMPAIDGRLPGAAIVFGPDREAEPDAAWYSRFSRGAARVYGAHGKVYRSACAIGQRIDLPEQFRTLIEAVYGGDAQPVPDALQTADDRALGGDIAQGAVADMNVISLREGYCGSGWSSDERIGTRLGDSIEATLVRVTGDTLEPWARGRCDADDDEWELSAIRVPGWWLAGEQEPAYVGDGLEDLVRGIKTQRAALKYRLILPMSPDADGDWRCTLDGHSPLRLSYCDRRGLCRQP